MAEQTVVDELVVQLSLDAEQYTRAEATIERNVDRTDRKAQERARTTDRRDKDQQKRLKDIGAGVRAFTMQVAAAGAVVGGLGVAVGASLVNLLGFETGLRRQAVGTALSNREMQAWGATARRLGGDAQAGAQAIADLAKERQQFELTGNAPTMQALARMGVNVDRGRPIEDILADAQQLYRNAPEGQRQQFENTLSAQGVSADLILMIKSEIDARDAYTRSFAQSSEENRKALDAVADSLETFKATAVNVAGTLLSALQPAIEVGAEKLSQWAVDVAAFANDVTLAGGGVRGFMEALNKNAPEVAAAVADTAEKTRRVGGIIDTFANIVNAGALSIAGGLRRLGVGIVDGAEWAAEKLNLVRAPWKRDMGLVDAVKEAGRGTGDPTSMNPAQRMATTLGRGLRNVESWARDTNATHREEQRLGRPETEAERNQRVIKPIDQGLPNVDPATGRVRPEPPARPWSAVAPAIAGPKSGTAPAGADALAIMQHLTVQYDKTPAEAAAIVANWQGESALKANAFNPEGGGTGARGIAQWRGARTQAFLKRYGMMPDQAPIAQQIEFAMTDPYERQLMQRALGSGYNAQSMGVGVSRVYEAHGNVAEDARRGRQAAQLEREYRQQAGDTTNNGPQVNIQNLNVRAEDPGELVGGLQRLSGSQNYNTVIR